MRMSLNVDFRDFDTIKNIDVIELTKIKHSRTYSYYINYNHQHQFVGLTSVTWRSQSGEFFFSDSPLCEDSH